MTPAQKKLLTRLGAGQSFSTQPDFHVANRLKDGGYITNGRCSGAFDKIFTYYDLTEKGLAALVK